MKVSAFDPMALKESHEVDVQIDGTDMRLPGTHEFIDEGEHDESGGWEPPDDSDEWTSESADRSAQEFWNDQ